jgi:hypothetical protein
MRNLSEERRGEERRGEERRGEERRGEERTAVHLVPCKLEILSPTVTLVKYRCLTIRTPELAPALSVNVRLGLK